MKYIEYIVETKLMGVSRIAKFDRLRDAREFARRVKKMKYFVAVSKDRELSPRENERWQAFFVQYDKYTNDVFVTYDEMTISSVTNLYQYN